jgi:hypothetical protein
MQRQLELAEDNLRRAETGRQKLRDALASQRATFEAEIEELKRQVEQAQAAAMEQRIHMTDDQRKAELKELRNQLNEALGSGQRHSLEAERESQQTLLAAAHTFHMQQQRFHEKLQAENLALHQREREREARELPLQQQLHDLQAQVQQPSTESRGGGMFGLFQQKAPEPTDGLQAGAVPSHAPSRLSQP